MSNGGWTHFREIREVYKGLKPEVRNTLRGLHVNFRELWNYHAAELLSRGYMLGVMAGLGNTQQDEELYANLFDSVVPRGARADFKEIFMKRANFLGEKLRREVADIRIARKEAKKRLSGNRTRKHYCPKIITERLNDLGAI